MKQVQENKKGSRHSGQQTAWSDPGFEDWKFIALESVPCLQRVCHRALGGCARGECASVQVAGGQTEADRAPRAPWALRGAPNPRTFDTRFRREAELVCSLETVLMEGRRHPRNSIRCPVHAVPPDLQKHPHDGQSVGLVRGLHEAGVFVRVPVNDVELQGRSITQGEGHGVVPTSPKPHAQIKRFRGHPAPCTCTSHAVLTTVLFTFVQNAKARERRATSLGMSEPATWRPDGCLEGSGASLPLPSGPDHVRPLVPRDPGLPHISHVWGCLSSDPSWRQRGLSSDRQLGAQGQPCCWDSDRHS